MRADNIAGQFSVVLGSPLAGISFNHEIPPFYIAKASDLLEKSAVPPSATNSHVVDFYRRIDHRDALDLRRLLGTRDDRHAAAAPPSTVMNSRRCMCLLQGEPTLSNPSTLRR